VGGKGQGSGFGSRDSGFGFQFSGCMIRVSGFGIRDSGFGIQDSGFEIWDSGFGIRDSSFGVLGSGFGRTEPKPPSPGPSTTTSSVFPTWSRIFVESYSRHIFIEIGFAGLGFRVQGSCLVASKLALGALDQHHQLVPPRLLDLVRDLMRGNMVSC